MSQGEFVGFSKHYAVGIRKDKAEVNPLSRFADVLQQDLSWIVYSVSAPPFGAETARHYKVWRLERRVSIFISSG